MSAYSIVDALMTLVTVGIGAWASWVLHARVRSVGSLFLLLSLALFIVYCMCSLLLSGPVLRFVESRAPSLVNEFAWGMGTMIPALLCLCMSVSFLAAARSIKR